MRTLRLEISYDGTDYCGWQIQPNGPTIQEEITKAIERVTGNVERPVASGRTDSGVHAIAQAAHWRTESKLPAATLQRAINAYLPEAIVIRKVVEADESFHAIRDAKGKLYRYVFHDGPLPDVFLRRYCWKVWERLDVDGMRRAAESFEGTHDFRCFETEWPNTESSVRTIWRCRPTRLGDLIYLDVSGDGFLYNMVRTIAGTLYEIGRGKWPVEQAKQIVAAGERATAGPTAPARGLFLVRVDF